MIKVDVKASCEKIKEKCDQAQLTPKQLQESLGVTVTAPYVWLNGKGLPKIETLLNLCELLHCTITDLLVVSESDCVDNSNEEPTLLNQYYYNKEGRRECWDEMKDISLTGTIFFDLWNAYKYMYRAGDKTDNSKAQDMKKAQNYIEHAKSLIKEYDETYGTDVVDADRANFDSMLDILKNIQNNA